MNTRKKNKHAKENLVKESLRYLRESRNFIFIVIVLFVFSGIVGFAFYEEFVFFDDFLKEIYFKIEGLNLIGLMLYIFYNNSLSALFALILGIVFGVFPVMNALLNGALIGYVLAKVSQVSDIGLGVAWRLAPHGIFELPAIFIALGLGMRLGASFFIKKGRDKLGIRDRVKERLRKSFVLYLIVIVPLLAIAACVEGFLVFYSR